MMREIWGIQCGCDLLACCAELHTGRSPLPSFLAAMRETTSLHPSIHPTDAVRKIHT